MNHRDEQELVLGRLIERFSDHGDREAISSGGRRVTYSELSIACNRLANGLLELGVLPGDRFAFLLPNGYRMLCCYLACARTGIVGVPIATRGTESEMAHQLRDSGAIALLHGPQWSDRIDGLRASVPSLREIICDREMDEQEPICGGILQAAGEQPPPPAALGGDAPFCVMYTGGTTGVSKAAIQTHRAWAACLSDTAEQLGLKADDRHAVVLPMTHAAWFTLGAHLHVGAVTHVLARWDPHALLETIERERLTTLHMIPTLLGDLLTALEETNRDVSSVRLLTLAGSPVPAAMYERARKAFGDIIGNIYGLTEAAGPVSFLLPADVNGERIRSAGKPGRYVEISIVGDSGETPEGLPLGEVALRGAQITPGYLGRPEETAAAFEDGWFLTGDIGYLDREGFLYVVDRKKDMIKTGGFNVYPKEIEEVLYRHPDVVEVAVLGLPDPKWMEAVTAVVVPRSSASVENADLIAHCRSHLAAYKVPKDIHLAPALPRTNFGKVDKRELQRRICMPNP